MFEQLTSTEKYLFFSVRGVHYNRFHCISHYNRFHCMSLKAGQEGYIIIYYPATGCG